MFLFTDIYCKHRPKYACREPPTITTSGPMSPPVSASLVNVSVCQDGGVGMPVSIIVINIQNNVKIFDVSGSSYQRENDLFIHINVLKMQDVPVSNSTYFVIWQKLSKTE